MSLHPDSHFSPIVNDRGFSSSGRFHLQDGVLSAHFTGSKDTHTVQYQLPQVARAAGVNVRIRLSQWAEIRYAAIGYMDGDTFKHIKAPNIRTDAWVEFGFTHQDIIWQLQNAGQQQVDVQIKNIRVFIKGKPSNEGASLDISGLEVLKAPTCSLPVDQQPVPSPLLNVLYGYLKNNFRNYSEDARTLLETSSCPMPGGERLEWPVQSGKPQGLEQVNTYRFSWHAQHPVISLLLHAHETQHVGAVLACRSIVEEWLRTSYDTPDTDTKFTWYDHGAAERLLAFILLWSAGNELGADQRFQARLGQAIVMHARLLACEAFYAYHQPLRYHNHAWFQDAALMAAALAFAQMDEATRWRDLAIERFEDQLDHLLVRDGGFAIFIENSIGYHHGVQKLALLMGSLVELSGLDSDVPATAQGLAGWSDFFRYPDGRTPAQGDTFRPAPSLIGSLRPVKPWPEPRCLILPKAGYCVVKGNQQGKPFMVNMLATSLSKTHKHEDNLSITLWYDALEWLIDPSFYSHEYQQPITAYLRSAKAHNNLYVHQAAYSKALALTNLTGCAEAMEFECKGTHKAYDDFEVARTMRGRLDKLELIVVDELLGSMPTSTVDARLNFHFAEGVHVVAVPEGFQLTHPASSSTLLLQVNPDNARLLRGVDAAGAPLSIAGQGFLNYAPTTSLEIRLEAKTSLSWSICAINNFTLPGLQNS